MAEDAPPLRAYTLPQTWDAGSPEANKFTESTILGMREQSRKMQYRVPHAFYEVSPSVDDDSEHGFPRGFLWIEQGES